MTTKEMLERAKEAFRQGYAKTVKEIADEARQEKRKGGRYEFKGEKA